MMFAAASGSLKRAVQRICDSGVFDASFYRAQWSDTPLPSGDMAAADHFHREGWRALCDPSQRFSTYDYLEQNEDVATANINPLLHYLDYGRAERRAITPAALLPRPRALRARPIAPTDADWTALAARLRGGAAAVPRIDVIVPVYKGAAETLRCLFSVLDATPRTPFRLVVVDDHAPDVAITGRLRWLAARDLIQLVRTPENVGFVRACNLGLTLHPDRDVVLLNADTEVFDDWLDRLVEAAAAPAVGTVTPFSNNAEICSYPALCRDIPHALEVSDRELDRLMATTNAGGLVDIPTGVGFCLFIARVCLRTVGAFDASTFGAGYGEENDLCRRIAAAGYRNVLATNVFVRHYGASSFGASKAARVAAAIVAVERKHPGYGAIVSDFIADDPGAPWRANIDAARTRRRIGGRGAMLFVGHNRGGGTERHMGELAEVLERGGMPVLVARPDPADVDRLLISDPRLRFAANHPAFDLRAPPGDLADALQKLGITHLHVHHLVDWSERAADHLRLACAAASLPYDVTIHDYFAICPRITLTDDEGFYCGEPDVAGCQACVDRHGSEHGSPAIWQWRERAGRLLRAARRVYVPADDVIRRLERHFPDVVFTLRRHAGEDGPSLRPRPRSLDGSVRHIGLIGALGPHKGAALLLCCARRAAERALPLRFTVLGYTDRDNAFAGCANVCIEGRYEEADLPARLATLAPDLLWFPALWPETFSYTLNAAFAAAIPPIAFDLGALAERIRRSGFGRLLPVRLMHDVDGVLDALSAPDLGVGVLPGAAEPAIGYPAPLQSYYGLRPAETESRA